MARGVRSAELAAADKLRTEHDPIPGTRTRSFLAVAFGVVFVASPLASQFFRDRANDSLDLAATSGVLVLALLVLSVWGRELLAPTLFNRRLIRTATFLFAIQIVVGIGAWRSGMPGLDLNLMMVVMWSLVTGMVAITIEPRVAPTCLGYVACFVFILSWPELRLFAMAVGNLVLSITLVWVWRPAMVQSTVALKIADGMAHRKQLFG